MTYTQIALVGVALSVLIDLYVFKTHLVKRRIFWVSYSIIVVFQLITNGILTGMRIVRYNGAVIVGNSTPQDHAPPFVGQGRIAFAPVEDLLFGFSLVLLTLCLWVWLGRRGVDREPFSGPPRFLSKR